MDEGRSQRAVANGRAMLALNGRLGTTGVCGMKKEHPCWRGVWGTHKFSSVGLRDLAYLLGWGESVGTSL